MDIYRTSAIYLEEKLRVFTIFDPLLYRPTPYTPSLYPYLHFTSSARFLPPPPSFCECKQKDYTWTGHVESWLMLPHVCATLWRQFVQTPACTVLNVLVKFNHFCHCLHITISCWHNGELPQTIGCVAHICQLGRTYAKLYYQCNPRPTPFVTLTKSIIWKGLNR